MKRIFFIIIFCLVGCWCLAQHCTDTFYRKSYHTPGISLRPVETHITGDGSTVITGRYNTNEVFITKLNITGNTVWNKVITIQAAGIPDIAGIKELANGYIAITVLYNNNCHIIVTDAAGNLIWSKQLQEQFLSLQLAAAEDNGIILAATIDNSIGQYAGEFTPLIIKLDSNGNVQFSYWFSALCSASTITGATVRGNMLYAYGRSEGCVVPADVEKEENIFILKMNVYTGELLQSVSYLSKRIQAYPTVTTMYNRTYADIVTAASGELYVTDRTYSFSQNSFGLMHLTMDTMLNLYNGKLFEDSRVFANTPRYGISDIYGNWSFYTTPDEADGLFLATVDIGGKILRERKIHFTGDEDIISSGKSPVKYKGAYINIVANYKAGNESYYQVYQNGTDNSADACFGTNTSFVNIKPFPVTLQNDNYFNYTASLAIVPEDGTVMINDFNVLESDHCNVTSKCTILSLPSDSLICDTSVQYIFTAQKNPDCFKSVFWDIDNTAVQSITYLNDSSVALQFNMQWDGYLYASVNSCHTLKDSIRLRVRISPADIALGEDTTICNGKQITLNAGNGFDTYRWHDGSGTSTFTGSQPGEYYVEAKNYCGIAFRDTIIIDVHTPASINLGNDTSICSNEPLLLDAGNGFTTYHWNTGSTDSYIYADNRQEYTVVATDAFGCNVTGTITITTLYPAPEPGLISGSVVCTGQNDTLKAGGGFTSYAWQDGSTDSMLPVTGPGAYKITVQNEYGCYGTDSVTINKVITPPKEFLQAEAVICPGKQLTISSGILFNDYAWSTGEQSHSIIVAEPGVYYLRGTDNNGCMGTDSITIVSTDCKTYFFAPDIFTPNNDGINDQFKPLIRGEVGEYRFSVYNRNGQLLFNTHIPGVAWDGTFNGKKQNDDAYVWVCSYATDSGNTQIHKGTVLLIR